MIFNSVREMLVAHILHSYSLLLMQCEIL